MKNYFFCIVSIVIGYSFGQNKLEMYNNTDKDIYASYAYYDFNNKCWSTKGWYKVSPYSTSTVDLKNYTSDIYIHGFTVIPGSFWIAETEQYWGNDISFCIDRNNSFEIRFADQINCDNKKKFSKRKIFTGLNKWTFNP